MDGGQREIIAVIGGNIYEEKGFALLSEMDRACGEAGFLLFALNISIYDNAQDFAIDDEISFIKLLKELPLAAVVILMESIGIMRLADAARAVGKSCGVPVFAMDKPFEGCISISLDFKAGFKEVVRHLVIDHGLKRVCMIAGIKDNPFSDERIDAWREVMTENGLSCGDDMLTWGDFWDIPARAAMQKLLDGPVRPEAVVCANDSMAIAACDVIKSNGLRVPEDIKVSGMDGIMSAMMNSPTVSTAAPDYAAEADFVIDSVLKAKRGETDIPDASIGSILRPGHSCGCDKAADNADIISTVSASFSDTNWYIRAMNRMLSSAATYDTLKALVEITSESIGMWRDDFHFIAMYSELVPEEPKEPTGHSFTQLLRCESGDIEGMGETFSSKVFLPGLSRLTDSDSDIHILIARRLHTADTPYGYIIEGLKAFNNRDLRRCEEFGMFLSTAINTVLNNRELRHLNRQLMKMNSEIEKISVMDYLTGIYNRRGFFNELDRMTEDEKNRGRYLTLFSIDMDGLKVINDRFGHEEGDFAIRAMAGAISHFAARNGICARYGGDEFSCVILTDQNIELSADEVRERFDDFLRSKADVMSKAYKISASVGSCSVMLNGSRPDIEKMMKTADEAMYLDKQERKKGRS